MPLAAHPDRETLVAYTTGRRCTGSSWTAASTPAIGLGRAGIGKGDRGGIWSSNRALAQYATAKIGGVKVNVKPAYRTHEMAYALRQSGTKLLISARSFKTSDYQAMVGEVRDQVTTLEQVVFRYSPESTELSVSDPGVTLTEVMHWDLLPGDPINIQYASGTTGYPMGATLSHCNILNNGFFTTELLGFNEEDRLCIPLLSTTASAW